VRIGVVSDTHGFIDARLEELSAGVEVSPHRAEATIFSLERYNRKLSEKVWLPVGG